MKPPWELGGFFYLGYWKSELTMPKKILKLYSKPLAIFIIVVSTIALVEFLVMSFLPQLPGTSIFNLAIIDVLILSLVTTPMLYFVFFKPLRININSLKQANDRISQQQYVIEKAKELGQFGAWELDFELNKLTWTDEVYRIFGVPIGTDLNYDIFLGLTHPEDKDFVVLAWDAALKGKPFGIEHRILVDGGIKWVRVKAEVEFKKDGRASRGIGFVQDITEIKSLQERSIRAAQLASAGELATMVAHEVNNPLSGVIGYAEVFSNRACEDCNNKDLLQRIIKEGYRISKTVGGLLTFSYDSNGQKSLQEVEPVIFDALALMSHQIEKQGIHLVADLPENLPRIKCNSQQIGQVVLNIVRNACQALLEGLQVGCNKKIIKVEALHTERDGQSFLQISIVNNGPNIPTELLEKIDQPFFTTKPAGVGTGLGLSISMDIMDNHNGVLEVRSDPGEFTEMILLIPAEEYNQGDII